ncbi:type IV toxin-antitoxin system YeeU family antitoxin, partial [Escherichia coli]|uniref:type IV toxin-antitoxin system YeeU family antitoxin n=1 Tax=Escherichia coli TaxID=562 RepID=UPI001649C8E6
MSDKPSRTTHPDDNHDRPWWGLPCTARPCLRPRLVQEGNRLHYRHDSPALQRRFRDSAAYPPAPATPLLLPHLAHTLPSAVSTT